MDQNYELVTTPLQWNDIKPFINSIEFKMIDQMSEEMLMELQDFMNSSSWHKISKTTLSPRIILSKVLRKKLVWKIIIERISINPKMAKKMTLNKGNFKLSHDDIIKHVNIKYNDLKKMCGDRVQDNTILNFYAYQDFEYAKFKRKYPKIIQTFKNTYALRAHMRKISLNPSLKPNLHEDTLMIPMISWKNHLSVRQYPARTILDKIIPLVQNNKGTDSETLAEFVESSAWIYQKDITDQLIQNLLKIAPKESKDILYSNLFKNPHIDVKKVKFLEQELIKGNTNLNLMSIQSHRKFPLWFLDKYIFNLSSHQLFLRNKLTPHFLARQIRKYFELDPMIQKENKKFLADMVRFTPLEESFLRGISELIIRKELNKHDMEPYWRNISAYQKLSFKFIKDYKNYLYPDLIQLHQTINPELIEWFKSLNKINWELILGNETYYDLDQSVQEYYSEESKGIASSFRDNYFLEDDKIVEIEFYPMFMYTNKAYFYPSHLFGIDIIQHYVKAEDRFDYHLMRKGNVYQTHLSYCKENLSRYYSGFVFVNHYKAQRIFDLDIIRSTKEFYRENPLLKEYPTYLRVAFKKSDSYSTAYLTDDQLGRINNKKGVIRTNGTTLVRSFKVLDVKYFDDVDPFRPSV